MWKQAVLRIWTENKGILICLKIPIILLMLFGEIPFKEIPCMIVLAHSMLFMETTLDVALSPVENFLPQTGSQRKKMAARESIFIAGIYTLAVTLGYVFWFCLNERFSWEGETIYFLVKITVCLFLILFNIRMCFILAVIREGERAVYLSGGAGSEREKKAKRGVPNPLCVISCCYGGVVYLFFYTLGVFGDIKLFRFLVGSKWKFAYVIDGIIFVLFFLQTIWIWRQGYER
ncbi:MAG: hypothetical protein NC307_03100 [Roseburia sp.]|nr:hypothetical protein [Roseburia sp.]